MEHMSPTGSGHKITTLDVGHVGCSHATNNADSSDTVFAHISMQDSTLSISHAPNDVNGPPSNTTPHHRCSVTQAGLTHCAHADLTGNTNSTSITCGIMMNALYNTLIFLNTIFNKSSLSESASTPDINHETEYQPDNRRLVTPKLTMEETRFVSDFDNTSAESDEIKGPPHANHASTSSKTSSTSNTRFAYDGTNIPGYYRFFDNGIEYQDLKDVLAFDVMHIVQHPLVWAYTRDFAKRSRSLRPDDQAAGLLDFIGARSNIPEFRDKLFTVLEARSDLKGFLRKRT